ncbi:MAG TPA: aldo/keto reductase, partial [Ktedonobacteraceae bacterium]|nr:aldo/keto reductase [Ktedonobacteraceae bacterium]
RSTWYAPLEDQADIDRAVHWVLQRPGVFLNTVGEINLLPKVLDAASRFQEGAGPTDAEMQTMAARLQMEPLFV